MNKSLGHQLLSLGAPLLILLGIFGFTQRQGNDRWQSFPALLIGSGLIISGAVVRIGRRKKLLKALRSKGEGLDT